ncbi:gp53-like domain-containing protein [Pseudomonas sp. MWU13-2100]|uniref:gp53-like domain-containing protein n=1 Tax=Pseudomonas sp. MWU13-2100 TaxID=2935075 RepID=UPI00200F0B4A|nr:hypothetical protein [Pseudomonas sp. MWU13-2100]
MDYPKSVPSVGLVNGKFVDENPVNGTPGSLIPAVWGNSITDEVVNVIKASGLVPDESDPGQLLLSIQKMNQSDSVKYALDTGGAGAYAASYTPPLKALVDGLVLRFKAQNGNPGASTFSPNGLTAAPIVGAAHSALQGGEIVANGDVWVQWNSSIGSGSWVLVDSTGGAIQVGGATKSQHAVQLSQLGNYNGIAYASASTTLNATFLGKTLVVNADGTTQTLPAAAGLLPGSNIHISSFGTCTIKGSAAEMIIGPTGVVANSLILNVGEQITLTTNAIGWYVSSYARVGKQYSSITPILGAVAGVTSHIGGMVYGWGGVNNSYSLPSSSANAIPAGATVTIPNFGSLPMLIVPQGTDKVQTPSYPAVSAFSVPAGASADFTYVGSGIWFITGTAVNSSSADFSASLAPAGYQRLPSGLIIQWGSISVGVSSTVTIAYPIAFPTQFLGAYVSNGFATYTASSTPFVGITPTSTPLSTAVVQNGYSSSANTVYWFAFGK